MSGNQSLTNKGFNDALSYGKKLKQQGVCLDEVITSPVERCVQTAEKIIEGLDSTIKIKKSHLLGEPGIFVDDDKKAAKVFDKFTVCEVINSILNKEEPSGFLPIHKACRPLIEEIESKIALNKSTLYISHDAIIVPFMAYVSDIKIIDEYKIINYLDGYVVEKSHNEVLHSDKIKLRRFVL